MNQLQESVSPVGDIYQAVTHASVASKPWFITPDQTVTFGQLRTRIDKVSAWLKQNSIEAGQRIIIASTNDAEVAMLFVSMLCNGITVINLDPDTSSIRANALISKSDPAILIIDTELINRWNIKSTCYKTTELITEKSGNILGKLFGKKIIPQGFLGLLADLTPCAPTTDISAESIAYILYTSGTTTQPKGVCISHRALFSHLKTLTKRFEYTDESRIYNSLMLSHADGMVQGPVIGFYTLCSVYRPEKFEVTRIEAYLDAIYHYRISHLVAVPTMLALILKLGAQQKDTFSGGNFQFLISCGAQLDANLWKTFQEQFQTSIINVYGLTETVVGGVFYRTELQQEAFGSIGLPEDCELQIIDHNSQSVESGKSGELRIRGNLLMTEYFREPEMTASVFQNGWFNTGDIARCDEYGRYWILGRSKNIIIKGGYNIHPEEITEVLEHCPGVIEAITFGIPDPVWGETVAALVVLSEDKTKAEILSYCNANLDPRKVPNQLKITKQLPRGRSGKVQLEEVRKLFEETPENNKGNDHVDQVIRIAAECFRVPAHQLTLQSSSSDIPGWDSLAHMEFVVALESAFGMTLSPKEIMSLQRIEHALAIIRAKQ